jgi:alginate O-acetyltransferase complex protein AlgI
MLFNSLEFAVFFPLVCLLYFTLPDRYRTLLLLVASCIFYMAFVPAYILILGLTIAIDYVAGIFLETTTGSRRRMVLWMSILATCVVLFVFKYFNFFTDSFCGVAALAGWEVSRPALDIILPIGLSFHTFQSLSYVIEVYRGEQKAERNFVVYATYVMFFPQLVAGPIERPQNLLHQFYEHHSFDYDRVTSGLKRMAWGLFKKLVVADRLALMVNDVYAAPQDFNGLQLTLATFFFAYQIYCDFSGYSDIAIGTARVLGFRLMENFDTPYHAQSVGEFWRRWHISLSGWFRDYVYIPLGGSRINKGRWVFNLMVTFGISGLWHGANWTYVVWGLLNGFYLVVGGVTEKLRAGFFNAIGLGASNRFRIMLRVATTFVLVCAAWVVFRAKNLGDAWYVFSHFWHDWNFRAIGTEQFLTRQLPVALVAIVLLELGERVRRLPSLDSMVARLPLVVRWSGYAAVIVAVVLFGVYRKAQFIYFQF